MQQLILGFKREYWEHKRLLVLMPVLVSAMFVLVTIAATLHDQERSVSAAVQQDNPSQLADATVASLADTTPRVLDGAAQSFMADAQRQPGINENTNSEGSNADESKDFWFSGVYLATAWLAALFYALSSLYNDRRDNSILYWKTLPVSELQNVMLKFGFAVIAFSAVAIVISWLTAAVLIGYAQWVLSPEMWADSADEMTASRLVLWPILAILVAPLWCAPVFALVLYVSAKASKMPLLWLLVPIVVVRITEALFFDSNHIVGFLFAHSPFALVANFSSMGSATEFLNTYLIDSFFSLVVGVLFASVLIWRTTWLRDHEFELT